MTRTTLVRTTAIALATAALAAPAAQARPDAVAPAATPAAHGNRFATRPIIDRSPVQPDQPSSAPVTVTVPTADHGIDWATIGIGIGGSLLAVGGIVLVNDRVRRPRARISA